MDHLNKSGAKLGRDDLSAVAGGQSMGGNVISSGSFMSASGSQLDIVVQWSVADMGGVKQLHVDVSTTSYSLNYTGMAGALELDLNGVKYYANTQSCSYSSTTAMTTNPLGSFDSIAVTGSGATVNVIWHFNGSYGGKQFTDISVTGALNF